MSCDDMITHRILIVDDDRDSVEVSSLLLELDGHECRTASTGRGALDELARFAPDIVMLDINLPDMSGYHVASQMRARAGRGVYLAAVTGWNLETRAWSAAGFDQQTVKPTDRAMLRSIVRNAETRM